MKGIVRLILCASAAVLAAVSCTKLPEQPEQPTGGPEQPDVPSGTVPEVPPGAVSLAAYASLCEGSDWAPAFAGAFADADSVYVPAGEYATSTVAVPSGKTILGAGEKTVLRPLGTKLFSMEGTYESGITISSDIADYSNQIMLTGSGGIRQGDDILIVSQRNCMLREGTKGLNYDPDWVLGRTRNTSVFFGEFDTVQSISGNAVTTSSPRVFPHYYKDSSREPASPGSSYITRTSTRVYRLEMVSGVTLKDFAVTGSAGCYRVMALKYAKDCLIEGIRFHQDVPCYNPDGAENLSLVHAYSCKGITVKNCSSTFSQSLSDHVWALDKVSANFSAYNIFRVISCWDSGFEGCSSNCATHAFNITRGSSGTMAIAGGRCYIRGCKSSHNIWSGVTVQQGVWNSELTGNEVTLSGQGICCAGRCSTIKDNKLSTNLPHSTSYYYTHITSSLGGEEVFWGGTGGIVLNEGYAGGNSRQRTVIQGNHITGFYTGVAVRDGYEEKNIFEEGLIDIKSNAGEGLQIGVGIFKNTYNKPARHLDLDISGNSFSLVEGGKQLYLPAEEQV